MARIREIASVPNFPLTGAELMEIEQALVSRRMTLAELSTIIASGSFTQTGTGAIVRAANAKMGETLSVKDFGALCDGATNDRAAVQAAINEVYARGGGRVMFPAGVTVVGASGSTMSGMGYALLLKSGVTLCGDSMMGSTLKLANGADTNLIVTDTTVTTHTRVGVRNLFLDGNEANQGAVPAAGFNLWAYGITDLEIENVYSLNPAGFGFRIEKCNRAHVTNIICFHSSESNSDGIHFIDTNNVTGGNFYINSAGDDGFIIEAKTQDVENYALGNINVRTASVLAASRGILLLADPAVITAVRAIRNVSIFSSSCDDCAGPAVVLSGAAFSEVAIQNVSNGCRSALYLAPGTVTYPGYMRNCSFNIVGNDTVEEGIVTTGYGTISNNRIEAQIRNPGNNKVGVDLKGDGWSGEIRVDYDPNATKTLFNTGISISGSYCDLAVSSIKANPNLLLQGTATFNNIKIGSLRSSSGNELQISGGAVSNRFTGGYVSGPIVNTGGATNQFSNVGGACIKKQFSLNMATDGDGTASVVHGLNGTPAYVWATVFNGAVSFFVNVIAMNATIVDFRVTDAAGAPVTSGSYNVLLEISM